MISLHYSYSGFANYADFMFKHAQTRSSLPSCLRHARKVTGEYDPAPILHILRPGHHTNVWTFWTFWTSRPSRNSQWPPRHNHRAKGNSSPCAWTALARVCVPCTHGSRNRCNSASAASALIRSACSVASRAPLAARAVPGKKSAGICASRASSLAATAATDGELADVGGSLFTRNLKLGNPIEGTSTSTSKQPDPDDGGPSFRQHLSLTSRDFPVLPGLWDGFGPKGLWECVRASAYVPKAQ